MNMNKLMTAALLAFTVACSTPDQGDAPPIENVDYSGILGEVALEISASNISDGFVISDLALSGGASVSAKLQRLDGLAFEPGRYTLKLAEQSFMAIGGSGQPEPLAASDVGDILNDRGAQPVCGAYPVAASGVLFDELGNQVSVGLNLASTAAVAFSNPGSVGGCRLTVEAGQSCGGDCTISLWIYTFTGRCAGTPYTAYWYVQGEWVAVPMLFCYCDTTASTPTSTPSPTDSPSGSPTPPL